MKEEAMTRSVLISICIHEDTMSLAREKAKRNQLMNQQT